MPPGGGPACAALRRPARAHGRVLVRAGRSVLWCGQQHKPYWPALHRSFPRAAESAGAAA
jgi:hypothetical protein